MDNLKALVFDVFGTVVDWRGSLIAEGIAWGKEKGLDVNWDDFADRWRLGYQPAMDDVRSGRLPWTRLDDLHRRILDEILPQFGITGLSESEKSHWAHVWRRLKPWPDSAEGLTRLRRKYIVAPMSNGNVALMAHLAKFGGMTWDAILGAELVQHYKPDPQTYLSAPYLLDLKPADVMMCAAHVSDLRAARSHGLRTGFIHRPLEYGSHRKELADKAQPGDFDLVASNIVELAEQLGV
jgi:2-haloacid dehalogenase